MAESTIDKLQIEIEAESKKAATSLDDFIGKLEKMQTTVGDLQVGKLNDLKSALKGLASISIKGATKEMGDFGAQIDKLVTKANRKLEKELVSSFSIASSKAKKEIHSIIASMTEMEKTGFKTGDQNAFTQLSTDMVDLADVVRSSISTMDEQLADFFEYWKSLKPIYISEKIVTDAKHTGEWQEAVHSYVGKFTTDINKMGAELDKVYQEMQEMYPNLFPSGTELTGASQFTQLLEVLHQCKKAIEETSEAEMEFGNRVDSVGPTIMGRYTELEAQINETKKAQSELAESTPETTFDLGGLASLTSAVKNLVKSAGDDKSQNSFAILEANIKNLCEAAKGAESIRGFNDALSGLNKAMANAPKSANFEPLAKSLTTLSKVNTEGLQGLSNVDGENIRKVVDAFNGFTFTGDFSGLTEALKSFPTKAKLTSFTNGINTISEANSGKAVDALNTFANATSSENISGIGEAIKGFPTENRLVSFSNGLNAIAGVDGNKVAGVLNRIGSATYSDGITNLGEAIKNFPSEAKVAKFADSIYDLGVLNAGGLSALLNVFKDSSFGDGIKALGDGIRNLPSGKAIETLPDKFEKLGIALERIKDIDITNIATAAQALSNVTASADGAASIAALATALKDLRSEANSEKAKIVDDDDVEDVNGYSSELEELIAKIREYKATISGMERGKIDFDEDTYNEAVSQIKALEDQLKDYKVSLQDAESTGGGFDAVSDTAQQAAQDIHDAVQAARDFNNAASNANDPTLNGSGAGAENIKVYSSEIEELIAKIKEYKTTISGMESGKIAFDNDKYDEAVSQIGILNEKLKEYKQALADTERENEEAKNYFDNLDDSIIQMSVDYAVNQKAASLFGNIMSGVKSALSALAGGLKTVGSGLLSLGEHFAKVGAKAASFVATIGKTILKITTMGTSFNKLKGKVQSLSKSLEGLNKKLSRMTRLFTMMAVRKLYTAVFDEVGEAIEHLAQKSDDFNEKVSELISSCKYLGHTVAAMAEPLLNIFGDALTTIIDKLATAISYVNQFLAAISGKTYYTAAKKVAEDYAESLDDASDSASSLNKQLQGFNELNNLTSSSSSSSGDDDSLEDCYETLEVEQDILDFVQRIKDAWDSMDFTELGNTLGTALKDALDSIDWDSISETAQGIAARLATLINGFVEAQGLGTSIGSTVGNALNTGISTADTFVTTLHWESLGTIISDTLNSVVATINWSEIGQLVAGYLNGIFTLSATWSGKFDFSKLGSSVASAINTALSGINWSTAITAASNIGSGIADFINNSFTSETFSNVGTTVSGLLNTAISGVLSLGEGIDWTKLGESISTGINDFFETFDSEDVAGTLNAWICGALDAVGELLTDTDFVEIGNSICDFLKNLDFGEAVSGIAQNLWKAVQDALDLVAGMLGGEKNPDTGEIEFDVANTFSKIESEVSPFLLGIGALLVASGISLPVGIAAIAAGAAGLVSVGTLNWGTVSETVRKYIGTIEEAVGGAFLALGAVLTFSGASIPVGLAFLVAGAKLVYDGATVDWNSTSNKVASVLETIGTVVGGAMVAIGAILVAAGVSLPIGLALIAGGALTLFGVTEKKVNWDSVKKSVQDSLDAIETVVSAGLLTIGAVLAFSGIAIPLGISLMAIGAKGLGDEIADNWDSLVESVTNVLQGVEDQVTGAAAEKFGINTNKASADNEGLVITAEWADRDQIQGLIDAMASLEDTIGLLPDEMKEVYSKYFATFPIENPTNDSDSSGSVFDKSIKGGVDDVLANIEVNLTRGSTFDADALAAVTATDMSVQTASNLVQGSWSDMGYTAMTTSDHTTKTTALLLSGSGSNWSSNGWTALTKSNHTTTTTSALAKGTGSNWNSNGWTALTTAAHSTKTTAQVGKDSSNWNSNGWTALTTANHYTKTTARVGKDSSNWNANGWTALTKSDHYTKTTARVGKDSSNWNSNGWTALTTSDHYTKTTARVKKDNSTWSSDGWTALTKSDHTTTTKTALKKDTSNWNSNAWTVISAAVSGIGYAVSVALDFVGDVWNSIKSFFGFAEGGYISSSGVHQFAEGGIVNWNSIQKYGSGTSSAHGTMFVAGEAGPEIVGHVNGQTEVLNRSQLADTMQSAVVNAFAQYLPIWNAIYSRMADCANAISSATLSSADYVANTYVEAVPTIADVTGASYAGNSGLSSEDRSALQDIMESAIENVLGTYVRRIADNTDDMDVNVQIGDKPIFNSVRRSANEYYTRTGKPAFAQ